MTLPSCPTPGAAARALSPPAAVKAEPDREAPEVEEAIVIPAILAPLPVIDVRGVLYKAHRDITRAVSCYMNTAFPTDEAWQRTLAFIAAYDLLGEEHRERRRHPVPARRRPLESTSQMPPGPGNVAT